DLGAPPAPPAGGAAPPGGPPGPPPLPAVPTRLRNYRLLEPLGQGSQGVVYKALHLKLNRLVALKVRPAGPADDPQAAARLAREVEALGALRHPNVVQATDADAVGGFHFLVMEYVEGVDAGTLVRLLGPLPVAAAAAVVRQAALGLQYVHERG